MEFVKRIAIGVGIAPGIMVYAAAQNKHLLLGKLPNPRRLKVYQEREKDVPILYFIDKKVVVLRNDREKAWCSIDLKTGEKRYLPKVYIEKFIREKEDTWKLQNAGSLIVYLFRIETKVFMIDVYERNIQAGILILEDYLRNIEKVFKIFKAEHRDIEVDVSTYLYSYYRLAHYNELRIYFENEFPVAKTPLGYYKVGYAELDLNPDKELRIFLEEPRTTQQGDALLKIYPYGVTLEELSKIIVN